MKCITTKQACVFIALVAPGLIPESAHAGRQYNPTLRRFLQRDPVGVRDGLNSYVRTKGNPVLMTDSTDATKFDALTQGSPRTSGHKSSSADQDHLSNSSKYTSSTGRRGAVQSNNPNRCSASRWPSSPVLL
ncbi:MAG: RHS repeat-associated core domain-containing protein [Planctomycetota bacterium]